jgi:aspartate/tyrosine/aromatic aminotransferase
MEDGYALADEALRQEIATDFPQTWKRMQARREFMSRELGIHLQESFLPLSNLAGIIAPWGLSPRRVLARR